MNIIGNPLIYGEYQKSQVSKTKSGCPVPSEEYFPMGGCQGACRNSQNNTDYCLFSWCLAELGSKCLLLMIAYTPDIETKVELSCIVGGCSFVPSFPDPK